LNLPETDYQTRFIGYHLGSAAATLTGRRMQLTVGVISNPGCRCERFEFSFDIPTKARSPLATAESVSGTIGLVTGQSETSNVAYLDQIVERNLADILTTFILEFVERKDSVSLIKGPPLSKMMGRLAYRCFPQEATVAVLTYNCAYAEGLIIDGYGKHPWSGPFPSLHEDSVKRTYFSAIDSGRRQLVPARLDIFHQDIGFYSGRENSYANRLLAKLDKVNNLVGAQPGKDCRVVPRPIEILDRSLAWSDQRFRLEIEQHQERLRDHHVPEELLGQLSELGITALEPKRPLHGRMQVEPKYAAELLFEELQRSIEVNGGMADGLTHFLRNTRRP
jgi:hypothetical protein